MEEQEKKDDFKIALNFFWRQDLLYLRPVLLIRNEVVLLKTGL